MADAPIVQPNYLADEHNQRVLISGLRIARQLLRTPELQRFFASETLPGDGVIRESELLAYTKRLGVSCHHVVETSRMGPPTDPTAVVDDALRIHGIDALGACVSEKLPSRAGALSTWHHDLGRHGSSERPLS